MPPDPNKLRVKLYQLNQDGQWDDRGTGHVSCQYAQKHEGPCLVVISEENSSVLLESKVSMEMIYQRQGDTIISWNDAATQIDMALSFQEASGCADIWEQISAAQGRFETINGAFPNSEDVDLVNGNQDDTSDFSEGSMHIPEPDLNNLNQVLDMLSDVSPFRREKMATAIIKQEYISKLVDLFHICEDLDSVESLHTLFRIFKAIVLLNESAIFELITADQYFFDVVGVLEYDPDVAKDTQHHRDFLRKNVVFKEVVPISNANVVAKIHQNFRLSYLKDVILPRALDDATFATINSVVFFNNVEIVNHIHADDSCLEILFRRLRSNDSTPEQYKDLVCFLQELCNLAKNLQLQNRSVFYRSLTHHGFYDIFERILADTDPSVRLAGTDILVVSMNHDASLLRNYLLSQKARAYPLFNHFITALVSDPDSGIKAQITEIIRTLIDPETMEATPEKDAFLNLFYDDFIDKLISPLSVSDSDMAAEDDEVGERRNVGRNHICEILSFCVQHHGYRIKYFILRNNIVLKVLKLLRHREKYLVLVAIRFLRACVGIKDEFYNRYMIKNNLFDGVLDVFLKNGTRYNLINSAIIELFDFIRKENIKSLVSHVVQHFKQHFEKVDYVETFRQLILKYEQNQELQDGLSRSGNNLSSAGGSIRVAVYGGPSRQTTADEDDAYFNESDDEDETSSNQSSMSTDTNPGVTSRPTPGTTSREGSGAVASPSLRRTSLVDYDDDDDDITDTSAVTGPDKENLSAVGPARRSGGQRPGERVTSPPLPNAKRRDSDTTMRDVEDTSEPSGREDTKRRRLSMTDDDVTPGGVDGVGAVGADKSDARLPSEQLVSS